VKTGCESCKVSERSTDAHSVHAESFIAHAKKLVHAALFACTQRLLGKTAEFVSDASPGAQRRLEYIQCRKYGYDMM